MALVQNRTASIAASATSASLAFNNPCSLNNRAVMLSVPFPQIADTNACTDNASGASNSYHQDADITDVTVGSCANVWSANIAANPSSGNLQLSISFVAAVNGGDIEIQEVSGLVTTSGAGAVDVSGTTAVTSVQASPISWSTSANANADGEYVVGCASLSNSAANMGIAASSGTTLDDKDDANGAAFVHETNGSVNGSAGSVGISWTNGNTTTWVAAIVAYKLAPPTVIQSALPFPRFSGLGIG